MQSKQMITRLSILTTILVFVRGQQLNSIANPTKINSNDPSIAGQQQPVSGGIQSNATNDATSSPLLKLSEEHILLLASLSSFLLGAIVCCCIIVIWYINTKTGKSRMKRWWIYFRYQQVEYEKRWRYSRFTDYVEGKNIVNDAVREHNDVILKKHLENGAYVNTYTEHGQTALHMAIGYGAPKCAELLIKYGADKTLLNCMNQDAETWAINMSISTATLSKKRIEDYKAVKRILRKYRKKEFRQYVPDQFPVSSFHVLPDEACDVATVTSFNDTFLSMTTSETNTTITHYVVNVNSQGELETNDFSKLYHIFNGSIVMKSEWMNACIMNKKNLLRDTEWLVKDVRFRGKVYRDCIPRWTEARAKSEFPYLYGVNITLAVGPCTFAEQFYKLVTELGAHVDMNFTHPTCFVPGTHPHMHAHLAPYWIVSDGTYEAELAEYKKDNSIYQVMSIDSFTSYLLEKFENPLTKLNPPSTFSNIHPARASE